MRHVETSDLRRWEILAQVEEEGSLAAAAAKLSLSAPGVSQQIGKLERQYKVTLVVRGPRGTTLTPAGAVLSKHFRQIMREMRSAEMQVNLLEQDLQRSLRVASVPTATASILPRAVVELKRKEPFLSINLQPNTVGDAWKQVVDLAVDMGVVWHYGDRAMPAPNHIGRRQLFVDPLRLIVSRDHPLASSKTARLVDVAEETFVTRKMDRNGDDVLIQAAEASGFSPRMGMETNDYLESQGIVAAGLGVAVIPELALVNLRTDVVVINLTPNPLSKRIFYAVWPSPELLTSDIQHMVDELQLCVENLGLDKLDRKNLA